MKGMSGVSRAFTAMGQALSGMMQRSLLAEATKEVANVKRSRGKGRNKTSPSLHKVAMYKRAAAKRRNVRARSAK